MIPELESLLPDNSDWREVVSSLVKLECQELKNEICPEVIKAKLSLLVCYLNKSKGS